MVSLFVTRQLNHVFCWGNIYRCPSSFDPAAESNCEELLKAALQVDPENTEALQTLASVRMSQQRPDEAKEILQKAWSSWKDLDAGVSDRPPLPEPV
jgi:cytochrome c-type biogenesis protein CcmH/NrfG